MKRVIELLALLVGLAIASPALAAEADSYWNCSSPGNAPNWCMTGNANPLPVNIGPYTLVRVTADGSAKSSSGQVHTVTFSPTGSVTAGVITLYDSTSETGTAILSVSLPVTTFTPFSVQLDGAFTNGLFIGYDGTVANVQTTVSIR